MRANSSPYRRLAVGIISQAVADLKALAKSNQIWDLRKRLADER